MAYAFVGATLQTLLVDESPTTGSFDLGADRGEGVGIDAPDFCGRFDDAVSDKASVLLD